MRNKLFLKDDCRYCQQGKAFLDEYAPGYVEHNISRDTGALQLLLTLVGRQEVPVLMAGYEAAIGYDPKRWTEVLAHGAQIDVFDPYRLPEAVGRDPHDDE